MSSELRVDKIVPTDGVPTGGGGGIIQVKSVTKTNTFGSDSETFTDITGLSVTITPKFNTSKMLIMYSGCASQESSNRMGHVRLVRVVGGTTSTDIFIGDAGESNQARASSTFGSSQQYMGNAFNGTFMDSPATTSAVTYKLQVAAGDQGYEIKIGQTRDNSNEFSRARTPSSITVMEVSA